MGFFNSRLEIIEAGNGAYTNKVEDNQQSQSYNRANDACNSHAVFTAGTLCLGDTNAAENNADDTADDGGKYPAEKHQGYNTNNHGSNAKTLARESLRLLRLTKLLRVIRLLLRLAILLSGIVGLLSRVIGLLGLTELLSRVIRLVVGLLRLCQRAAAADAKINIVIAICTAISTNHVLYFLSNFYTLVLYKTYTDLSTTITQKTENNKRGNGRIQRSV